MRHIKSWARYIAGAMTATLLVACGGSGSAFVPQFNVTERELYEPVRAESGIVAQRGSGGISLQLESAVGSPLPQGGDTAAVGVDKFYFDLVNSGYITLSMSDRMLQVISAVELYDENQQLLWRMDASNREISNHWLHRQDYVKPAPRYEVRIIAAAGAVDTTQVFAWFGDSLVTTANLHDLAALRVRVPIICSNCNFSGAQLGAYQLTESELANVNLKNSWLVRITDPSVLSLDDFALFKILWDSTQVSGANMSGSNLSHVDFSGAVLTGAGNSPANFTSSNLSDVVFNGLNLDGVLMGGNLTHVNMSRIKFNRASMVAADLTYVIANDVDFSYANLRKAKLNKSIMNFTNFMGAILSNADFTGAILTNVDFTDAILDGATWTDGRICATPSRGSCQQIPPP